MKILSLLGVLCVFLCLRGFAQRIADPCFTTISPLGKYYDSDSISNLCGGCLQNFQGSNLLEWTGSEWLGQIPFSNVKRPPPQGCNSRALWLGYEYWTGGGEAVALLLDKPFGSGNQYTFSFTYCKDGTNPDDDPDSGAAFAPIVYTARRKPSNIGESTRVGRLPGAFGWQTGSITFTATPHQDGHQWLILHALETSGLILSSCVIPNPIEKDFLGMDATLCLGTDLVLNAAAGPVYTYYWNTGETNRTIGVSTAGVYSVTIKNHHCESKDSIAIYYEDCTPRLIMPNVFTPNGDLFNEVFVPKEYNYIDSGTVVIYNRWEEEVYRGDIFEGWDGGSASPGIYFYRIMYIDRKKVVYENRGAVTLRR